MKGCWLILGTDVADQGAQAEYGQLWAPIAEKFWARLNPTRVPTLLKEARNIARIIVVDFPSYEMAKACYQDPAYQEVRRSDLQASKRDLVISEGEIA